MTKTVEFYYDFVSPYSYLASTQIRSIADRTGAALSYVPFRILDAMKIVGNRPTTIESKAKLRYAQADVGRWAGRYGVPLSPNPKMQAIDLGRLQRGSLAARQDGREAEYADVVFRTVWAGVEDLTDDAVVAGVLDRAGLSGSAIVSHLDDAELAAELEASTTAAAERGVFGGPTFFVGEQMFFGNDRLDWVEAALQPAAA